ncbi:MAG: response regulator, partial [Solirubrobacteraceae bacterium]|nr:response regulator [Solirubrobacteraceae bacterium]
ITKPFGTEELTARVRAALRRRGETGPGAVIEAGDLTIDLAARRVTLGDREIHFTPIEYDLMRVLAVNRGRLVTHRMLLQEVWGPQFTDETHYLRVHVGHIRRKIEEDPSRPRLVLTDPGVGYRLA